MVTDGDWISTHSPSVAALAQPVRNNAHKHPISRRTAHTRLHCRTSAHTLVYTALDYDEVCYIALTPLDATNDGKAVQDLSQRHQDIQL